MALVTPTEWNPGKYGFLHFSLTLTEHTLKLSCNVLNIVKYKCSKKHKFLYDLVNKQIVYENEVNIVSHLLNVHTYLLYF
jgi:hypothetical protein